MAPLMGPLMSGFSREHAVCCRCSTCCALERVKQVRPRTDQTGLGCVGSTEDRSSDGEMPSPDAPDGHGRDPEPWSL